MANKLAGQRMKFSKARAVFYTAGDDDRRQHAARLMAEVLAEAPVNGFSEDDVTQGEDVPQRARELARSMLATAQPSEENEAHLVAELNEALDMADLQEIGRGGECVYAYGYRCAPDRLKVGSTTGDAVARVVAQIGTGTPDRPVLYLLFRTHDCRALEQALHGLLRLQGRRVAGAGAEWFRVTTKELLAAYQKLVG
ncbi:MAG: hypothetical protein GVY13_10410 [Alphaproteobacteria bacterium]|jgi:hypothetical protein|nr:hypothetical protein [Alphaproteobacteria bacterium]